MKIAEKIVEGTWPEKLVTADVAPAGGKSKASCLFANELLRGGVVESVMHFVPRKALQEQVEQDYGPVTEFNPGGYHLLLVKANRAPLFSRDEVGVVASYDQLASNPELYIDWARRHRTLVIFDEVQYLGDEDKAAWAKASVPLADAAQVVLAMSGTIWRHDKKRIPLLAYTDPDERGRVFPKADVRYTLRAAVSDSAVKDIEFVLRDGDVRWLSGTEETEARLSEAEGESQSKALRTFLLRSETWQAVVDQAVEHWENYRQAVYPSRMIVIAYDQIHAKAIAAHLSTRGVPHALAISEKDDAHEVIRAFRRGRPDVLVTVGMVSVGFDVSDLTHVVYLTNWRSLPQFVQAMARAMRIDYRCSVPPEVQHAFAFVPDDPSMRTLTSWIRHQVDEGIRERDEKTRGAGSSGQSQAPVFLPTGAVPGETSYEGGRGRVAGDAAADVAAILKERPDLARFPHTDIDYILKWQRSISPATTTVPALTMREQKGRLRSELHSTQAYRDKRLGLQPGTTTKETYRVFGKLDDGTTLEELQRRLEWVRGLG